MSVLINLLWILATLILIGFFSGYEIAFISANRLNIELKKKQKKSSGIILSKFLENKATFISTCLIGVNVFLVTYGLLFDQFINSLAWSRWGVQNEYIKLVIDTALSTLIVLVLGEFIPKAIFRAKNDTLLIIFAPIANFFYGLFKPIAAFFVGIAQWILKYIFNVHIKNNKEAFSKVDLEHFFQQTKEQEEINPELNKELFENALSLPSVKIRQFLIPRTEIEAIEINENIDAVKQKFIHTQLSKLVVYDDNIDNIIGYVHQLDLFKTPSTIKEILLTISAVPESMSASDLINKFTKERKSVAWVVDEFGGTAGIVTMEDVLEEIFGEIKDEYDTEELVDKQISENEYILSGRAELDFINEKYKLDFPENESETLSGYIVNEHGTFPKTKERIIIGNYQFDILNVSETTVDLVKLKKLK
ncbi:MAG: HlyC/CorC family transporter [Bacteroidetes bacterium]|nr:HlyC/CorC family transporter [Bacteroidota bacterium]MBS1649152.1 HlyC/CorC family transporter [Bacteroidota bacterium]